MTSQFLPDLLMKYRQMETKMLGIEIDNSFHWKLRSSCYSLTSLFLHCSKDILC